MTEIKNLTKKYGGKTALDGLSFALTDNRVNGLFGPSGAGKSTASMLVMAVCWCVIRVPYVTIMARVFPVLRSVSSGYPVTWALSSIVFTVYYFKVDWMHGYKAHA